MTEQRFDLLILDIDPRANDDADVLRTARGFSPAPILALSIRCDQASAANALENGADDYVQKPFSVQELLAKVRNAFRWKARASGKLTHIVTDDLEIDLLRGRIGSSVDATCIFRASPMRSCVSSLRMPAACSRIKRLSMPYGGRIALITKYIYDLLSGGCGASSNPTRHAPAIY